MGGYPREHVKDKGFWDGGTASHAKSSEGAGRTSSYPGTRKPKRTGIRTDMEFPEKDEEKK